MNQIARYVFQHLDFMGFTRPHKERVIVLCNDDCSLYEIIHKRIYPDGTEHKVFTTLPMGYNITTEEFRDWLMTVLLQMSCQKPDSRLPEITEEDRKWMRFEIN